MSEYYAIDFDDFVTKFVAWFLGEYGFEFSDGDFRLGNTNEQEQYFILQARNGHFYQYIKLGVGIDRYLVSDIDKLDLKKRIQTNFKYDGFSIQNIYVITQEDIKPLNITDNEIISVLNQDKFIISIEAIRNNRKDGILVKKDGTGNILSYIRHALGGLQSLNDQFYDFVIDKKEELKYNSQIIYLQKRLNDLFDNTQRRVYIANISSIPIQYVYNNTEFQNDYVYSITEANKNNFIVGDLSEIGTDSYDFKVYVPSTLVYNEDYMNSIINKYKLIDKIHTIETY